MNSCKPDKYNNSFQQSEKSSKVSNDYPKSNASLKEKMAINTEIFKAIKNHYHLIYDEKSTRLEYTDMDSISKFTYYAILENEGIEGYLISIYVPNISNINLFGSSPILNGDLNEDYADDFVISVHTEGGGRGANIAYQDLFVFINENGTYILKNDTSGYVICGCDEPMGFMGNFRIFDLQQGYLFGISSCFTNSDARCCPSLSYLTKVKFENDKLEFHSRRNRKINTYN